MIIFSGSAKVISLSKWSGLQIYVYGAVIIVNGVEPDVVVLTPPMTQSGKPTLR